MASFYQFQRVRIVVAKGAMAPVLGAECLLMRKVGVCVKEGDQFSGAGWETNLLHPMPRYAGDLLCVISDWIEPITYLPTAEDLSEIENAPDFRVLAPTHMPSDALRAAVLGEG